METSHGMENIKKKAFSSSENTKSHSFPDPEANQAHQKEIFKQNTSKFWGGLFLFIDMSLNSRWLTSVAQKTIKTH